MNEYIFYTDEGYTKPPCIDKKVDNCQMLGRAFGPNEIIAKKQLLSDNPWIEDCGFDPNKIAGLQLFNMSKQ
ncbi:MAG: hypothetical protein K6F33_10065 [Bacteroidales bacterium]|nr:hypothetical protein [Bacteroidales bacterium]